MSGIEGFVIRPAGTDTKTDASAPAAAAPASPPAAKAILLGFRKTSNLTLTDPAALPKALQKGVLAVNAQGSRFTHVTLNLEDDSKAGAVHSYKVGIGALAKLLNVSRFTIICKAIFGGLNELVKTNIIVVQADSKDKVMKEFVENEKNDMKGLAKELMKWQFNDNAFRKTLSSISKLNLTTKQKADLLNEILNKMPPKDRANFLSNYEDRLEALFGSVFHAAIKPYQDKYANEFAQLWYKGHREEAYEYLNNIPKNLGSPYLDAQLYEKLGPEGAAKFAKFIVTKDAQRTDPNQFLRESKKSDRFIAHFLSAQLAIPLAKDPEFARLIKLPGTDPNKYKLIFEHIARVADFSPEFKEYCRHVCDEANKHLGTDDITGLKFLISSVILKGMQPLVQAPPFNEDLQGAKRIGDGMIKHAKDVRKPEIFSFGLNLGGSLRAVDEVDSKELQAKVDAQVAEFYSAILAPSLSPETREMLIDSMFKGLARLPPEERKLKHEALEVQRKELQSDRDNPIITDIGNRLLQS